MSLLSFCVLSFLFFAADIILTCLNPWRTLCLPNVTVVYCEAALAMQPLRDRH